MKTRMGEDLALALALEGKTGARGETASLVALASTLAALPEPEIDATFADELEALLLTDGLPAAVPSGRPHLTVVRTAEKIADPTPRAPVVQMPRRRLTVRRSVAGLTAAASLMAFPVVAAASALPDSPFYGLKQKVHALEITLFGTPLEDGFKKIEFANEHIAEAQQLASKPHADQSLIARTLEMAAAKLREGEALVMANTNVIADLKRLAADARQVAGDAAMLGSTLTGDARDAFDAVLRATTSIQRAVNAALGLTTPIFKPAVDTAAVESIDTIAPTTVTAADTKSDDSSGTARKDPAQPRDGGDNRTPKEVDNGKREACQKIGEANMSGTLLQPITDPTCNKPAGNF